VPKGDSHARGKKKQGVNERKSSDVKRLCIHGGSDVSYIYSRNKANVEEASEESKK